MRRLFPMLMLVALAGCQRESSPVAGTHIAATGRQRESAAALAAPRAPEPAGAADEPVQTGLPALHVETDLARARRKALATGKPLVVLLVLGDWRRHC